MSETLSRKADLALADLTANGGLLNPEQNDVFVRTLMDQPTVLRSIRTVPMNAPQMKINKIGFGTRMLRPANQTGGAEDTGANDRYVAKADRYKAQTSQVSLNTEEVIAEVRIPYEVLEDNIERGNMADTILALIAERAALDLEELIISGDTASSDSYLKLMDGVLKKINTHTYDASGVTNYINLFNTLKKTMPTKYRRNLSVLRFFTSMDFESDYRVQVALRNSILGDAVLAGNDPLPVLGVPLVGAALMPTDHVIFTNPQNVIFGIQRNIRIEQDRDIRSREVVIVLTARVALAIEEVDAAVLAKNVGAAVGSGSGT